MAGHETPIRDQIFLFTFVDPSECGTSGYGATFSHIRIYTANSYYLMWLVIRVGIH